MKINQTNFFRLLSIGLFFAFIFGASNAVLAQTRKKPVGKKPVLKKPAPKVAAPIVPKIPMYTVETGQIIHVRMNGSVSSKTAKAGDTFNTTVLEPVYSNKGQVVIPTGSTIIGKVDVVKAAAKGGKPGEIDVSFTQVKLPNQKVYALNGSLTELDTKTAKSDTEGTASGDKMKNRKVIFIGGGGAGGAIIGGMIGGGLGAAIGAGVGALGGLITESQTKGEEATVKSGTEFGVYLNKNIALPKFVELPDDPEPQQ